MFPYRPFEEYDFLSDWARSGVNPFTQRDYVARELVRVGKMGAPLLSLSYWAPFDVQGELCRSLLSKGVVGGEAVALRLALVPKAMRTADIRHRDADGKLLPLSARGHTLRCKLGTKGGRIEKAHLQPDAVVAQFHAPALHRVTASGGSVHMHVDLTSRPTQFGLSDADTILRRFGYGIARPRYPRSGERRDAEGVPVDARIQHDASSRIPSTECFVRVDDWAVYELPQLWAELPEESHAPAPAPEPKRK